MSNTNPDIFETAYNCFYPGSCGRALNQSGERCQNNAVSLGRFTGFVWTGKPTRAKRYTVEKIPRYVDLASGGRDAEIEFP